jgi:hypothetical protein
MLAPIRGIKNGNPGSLESLFLLQEDFMSPIGLVIGCAVLVALLAAYVPLIYIRKTNKVLKVLQQIEINTRK